MTGPILSNHNDLSTWSIINKTPRKKKFFQVPITRVNGQVSKLLACKTQQNLNTTSFCLKIK